ncbi:hypothetical protein BU26DRAFT_281421 [Trematosphaeria pertusa]|uniref:F-box domain-containing protein n=1 Tax=Trematosphaeria pertusa TaxID=390896 RepID=A0A6A6IPC5_9PLEO|nr:uncharacterized protein BU26DRAFT_281421 [Trematosphaeria pertusa]KAF2251353.1 hypothetical protein BU26DRAFT_281421 [Trematosphaeria pertusa]
MCVTINKSNARKHEEHRPTGFMSLPPEVRQEIYELAMTDLPDTFRVPINSLFDEAELSPLTLRPRTLPPVCFLNRQVHAEALSSFFHRTAIAITGKSCGLGLRAFFRKNGLFESVRSVIFEEARLIFFPEAFVALCPGLHNLTLTAHAGALYTFDRDTRRWVGRTGAEIAAYYGYERLLESPQALRYLVIKYEGCRFLSAPIGSLPPLTNGGAIAEPQAVLKDLVAWFEEGFKKRERNVKVEAHVSSYVQQAGSRQ